MNVKCVLPIEFPFCVPTDNALETFLPYEVFQEIADIPENVKADLAFEEISFFSISYWQAFEKTYSENIKCKYLVLFQNQRALAWLPIQLIHFEGSQYFKSYDKNKFYQFYFHWFQRIISPFRTQVLVAGNVFSGTSFFKTSSNLSDDKLYRSITNALEDLQKKYKASALILKDIKPENEIDDFFKNQENFFSVQVQPEMKISLLEEWNTFDDYISALSAKYRTRLHKALKRGKDLKFQVFTPQLIQQYQENIQQLMDGAIRNNGFVLARPKASFFYEMALQFPAHFQLHGIFFAEQLVGFYTSFLSEKNILFINFAGTNNHYNHSHDLYLNLLFDTIQNGINNHALQIDLGRTAIEIKSAVGAIPYNNNAYVKLNLPLGNFWLKKSIAYFAKNPDWQLRTPFKKNR